MHPHFLQFLQWHVRPTNSFKFQPTWAFVSIYVSHFPILVNHDCTGHKLQWQTKHQLVISLWSYTKNWSYVRLSLLVRLSRFDILQVELTVATIFNFVWLLSSINDKAAQATKIARFRAAMATTRWKTSCLCSAIRVISTCTIPCLLLILFG